MKKKLRATAVLTAILSMAMCMNAFAAVSVSTSNSNVDTQVLESYAEEIQPEVSGTENGVIEVVPVSIQTYDDAAAAVTEQAEAIIAQSSVSETEEEVEVSVKAVVEVNVENVTEEELAAGVTVTLSVPGIDTQKSYAFLHYTNGAWEYIPVTINADGTVSGVFHSFSPVAIVEIAPVVEAVTAPQTSQTTVVPYAFLMLVLACGAVYCGKKAAVN